MRITKEELATKVVVRRLRRGSAPFVWEINAENLAEPLYVSPDSFASMEDAYRAGQARLPEFIGASRAMSAMAHAATLERPAFGGPRPV